MNKNLLYSFKDNFTIILLLCEGFSAILSILHKLSQSFCKTNFLDTWDIWFLKKLKFI